MMARRLPTRRWNLALQLVEGLKAAHELDIVPRDIESASVMLTGDGVAKLLDFGLAKTNASTKLTKMGSTVGTVAYMSPELARGEEADHRTELWSMGAVLYEMLTGQLSFPGLHRAVDDALLHTAQRTKGEFCQRYAGILRPVFPKPL